MALAFGLRLLVSSAFAATGLVLAAALIWHGTPPSSRSPAIEAMCGCPLPACGARADAGAMRYGVQSAGWCAASCWPLMLATMTGGAAHLTMTAAAAALMLFERTARPIRRCCALALDWRGRCGLRRFHCNGPPSFRRFDPWTLSAPLSSSARRRRRRRLESARIAFSLRRRSERAGGRVERPPATAAQDGAEHERLHVSDHACIVVPGAREGA